MTKGNISGRIIRCAFRIHNVLGPGFLEKVYENAFAMELRKNGFKVTQQEPLKVYYEDAVVGDYYADLIVDNTVILELKASKNLDEINKMQLLSYLKATNIRIGLLINFGTPKVQIKRIVYNYKE